MNNDTNPAIPFETLQEHLLRRHAVKSLRLHASLRLFGQFHSDDPDQPRTWHLDPSLSYRYRPELDTIGNVFDEHTGGPEAELGLEVWCDVGDRQAIEYNTLVSACGRLLQVHVMDRDGHRLPYGDERRLVAILREHHPAVPDHNLLKEYGDRSVELDRLGRLRAEVLKRQQRGEYPQEMAAWLRQIRQAQSNLDADLETISDRLVYDKSRCECSECCVPESE